MIMSNLIGEQTLQTRWWKKIEEAMKMFGFIPKSKFIIKRDPRF